MKYKILSVTSIILAISTCMGPTPSEFGDSEWVIEPSGSGAKSETASSVDSSEWVKINSSGLSDPSGLPESIGPPPGLDDPASPIENNNVKLDNYMQKVMQCMESSMPTTIDKHNNYPNRISYGCIGDEMSKLGEIPRFQIKLIVNKLKKTDSAFQTRMKSLDSRYMPWELRQLYYESINGLGSQIYKLESYMNGLPKICETMTYALNLYGKIEVMPKLKVWLSDRNIIKTNKYDLICKEMQLVGVRKAIENALEFTKQEYLELQKFVVSIKALIILYNRNRGMLPLIEYHTHGTGKQRTVPDYDQRSKNHSNGQTQHSDPYPRRDYYNETAKNCDPTALQLCLNYGLLCGQYAAGLYYADPRTWYNR